MTELEMTLSERDMCIATVKEHMDKTTFILYLFLTALLSWTIKGIQFSAVLIIITPAQYKRKQKIWNTKSRTVAVCKCGY
jgi:hypothetical protein